MKVLVIILSAGILYRRKSVQEADCVTCYTYSSQLDKAADQSLLDSSAREENWKLEMLGRVKKRSCVWKGKVL